MSCTWPADRSCLPPAEADEDKAQQQAAIDTAVLVLWSFTGRRYGCCTSTVRPCSREGPGRDLSYWLPGWAYLPELHDWRAVTCGCGPSCFAGGPGVVHLPGPVCSVVEVRVDGAVIDPSLYTLEGDRLYHNGGRWPDQDMRLPAGSPGTWTVDYLQGQPPPQGAAQMVGTLAREFLKACKGEACKLPRGVESMSRKGVTMRMAEPAALFTNRRTGIPEVDMWIAATNPLGDAWPGGVSSPDYPGTR